MTSTLRTLLDRVEKGEGRDLSLEGDLLRVLLGDDLRQWPKRYLGLGEAITSSIDAAVALVEKVLPGFRYGFNAQPQKLVQAWVADDTPQDQPDFSALAKSPARALVSALLRAKIAQEEGA